MQTGTALCVFCGSNPGFSPRFAEAAVAAGQALAQRGIRLVYGGGHIGLMGILADAMLAEGGCVEGVIPRALVARELAHTDLTRLHVVETMHERKARMAELSAGFIALPGGAGTLEEIFEQWTWAQLGIHSKPCAVLNLDGYFDPLQAMVERMVEQGFLSREHAELLAFASDIEDVLAKLASRIPATSMPVATGEGA
jgi:uncharacterized protein (TIGR00730 family)